MVPKCNHKETSDLQFSCKFTAPQTWESRTETSEDSSPKKFATTDSNNYVTVWDVTVWEMWQCERSRQPASVHIDHQLTIVEGNDECKEREKLENKVYSYMFAKQVMPCDTNFAEFKPLYPIFTLPTFTTWN